MKNPKPQTPNPQYPVPITQHPLPCYVNVGTGTDLTIKELAMTIKETVGFDGDLTFDTEKPDGTPRKLLNVDRLARLGWTAKIPIKQGIDSTYAWYKKKVIRFE